MQSFLAVGDTESMVWWLMTDMWAEEQQQPHSQWWLAQWLSSGHPASARPSLPEHLQVLRRPPTCTAGMLIHLTDDDDEDLHFQPAN